MEGSQVDRPLTGGIVGTPPRFASTGTIAPFSCRDHLLMGEIQLKDSVIRASNRPEVLAAIEDLYRRVQAEIDQRRPLCIISGRCCKFEEFGHRLYVTTLELARFLHDAPAAKFAGDWDGLGCPFQHSRLCTVHAIRPFGCRMFFCDATSTGWQNAAYEKFHAELKSLHERLNVPYFYVEWRQALALLGFIEDRLANVRSSP
jgi:Fe-S-cluster containining protein